MDIQKKTDRILAENERMFRRNQAAIEAACSRLIKEQSSKSGPDGWSSWLSIAGNKNLCGKVERKNGEVIGVVLSTWEEARAN